MTPPTTDQRAEQTPEECAAEETLADLIDNLANIPRPSNHEVLRRYAAHTPRPDYYSHPDSNEEAP